MYTVRVPYAEEGLRFERPEDAIAKAKELAAGQLEAQAKRTPHSLAVPWAVTADFEKSRVVAQGAILPRDVEPVLPGEEVIDRED